MVSFRMSRPFRLRRFRRDEDGAVSVEAVLWVPFFVMMVAFATDVSLVFHAQSRLLQVAQDVNRAISVGRITSTTTAASTIVASLPNYKNVTATVDVTNGIITADVNVPVKSVVAIGWVTKIMASKIYVRSQQYAEQ
ncbi:MAG: TadE/TadG family type IV pilus assembly protein [Paracoccaceae bacterium]